jgi:L-malate glycosyltransferase
MHICFVTADSPPRQMSGIARQRLVLAQALARMGHDVSLVCCGEPPHTTVEQGVRVRRVGPGQIRHFSSISPSLDTMLTASQALLEGVRDVDRVQAIDIIDVPLWGLQGFVVAEREQARTVVWLQTTSMHMLRVEQRSPGPDDRARIQLEQRMLMRAAGVLADSQSVLDDTAADYGLPSLRDRAGLAHLGLPVDPRPLRTPSTGDDVEALVVGRLERRKGTRELFEMLPALLTRCPNLRVRFAGADNSAEDGWRASTGQTYADYFRSRHADVASRVIFEGYVSEARLHEAYGAADLVIAPSLYESFGFVFLEAMRAGLPVVTFGAGGAQEIFENGEAHGGVLIAPGDDEAFAHAVARLAGDAALRDTVGRCGQERFLHAFTDDHMAAAHLAFYRRVAQQSAPARRASRVYQVMEALDHGDAVSQITRDHARVLKALKQPAHVLTRFQAPGLDSETARLTTALREPDSGLIFHYWGYNGAFWLCDAIEGPCALYYHNVTPASHYPDGSEGQRAALRGVRQLRRGIQRFGLLIGDSNYNLQDLTAFIDKPTPALHIYPVVQREWLDEGVDEVRLEALRESKDVNILFVGRVARNKRHDRVMETFDHYWRMINRRAKLWLVGNDAADAGYRRELAELHASLASRDHIHFTGKISDVELRAFYRGCHVFLCASEHEGFCVPIAQAMAAGMPVIAFAAAAVPETMGGAGILVHEWDTPRVAELVHIASQDGGRWRTRLIEGQDRAVRRFRADAASGRMAAVVEWMQTGTVSECMRLLMPANSNAVATLV